MSDPNQPHQPVRYADYAERLQLALEEHAQMYRAGQVWILQEFALQVGQRLGLAYNVSTASRWLAGRQRPSLDVVEIQAELLSVDPGWLAFGRKCSAEMRGRHELPETKPFRE